MGTRSFALLAGFFYFVIGIFAFLPGLTQPPPPGVPRLAMAGSYGYVLGLFLVNVLMNFVHIVIGAWGFLASRNFGASQTFARSLAILFGVLTLMGVLPGWNTAFGLMPLFGHDVWLHAGTAALAAYFGFVVAEAVIWVRRTENVKSERVKIYEERPQL